MPQPHGGAHSEAVLGVEDDGVLQTQVYLVGLDVRFAVGVQSAVQSAGGAALVEGLREGVAVAAPHIAYVHTYGKGCKGVPSHTGIELVQAAVAREGAVAGDGLGGVEVVGHLAFRGKGIADGGVGKHAQREAQPLTQAETGRHVVEGAVVDLQRGASLLVLPRTECHAAVNEHGERVYSRIGGRIARIDAVGGTDGFAHSTHSLIETHRLVVERTQSEAGI